MIESQLCELEPQGCCLTLSIQVIYANYITDEASFAIVLELQDDKEAPVGPQDEGNQDPPPWVPADKRYTTAGTPDNAQLHLLRAVETGIINVSLMVLNHGDSLLDECLSSLSLYRNQKRNSEG